MLNSVITQFVDDTYYRVDGALGRAHEDLYDQVIDEVAMLELNERWSRLGYLVQSLTSIALKKDLNKANGVDKDA